MDKFATFHKTKLGYVVFAVVDLILMYIFASIAIDTANMWAYLAAIICLGGVGFNIFYGFKTIYAAEMTKAKSGKHGRGRR